MKTRQHGQSLTELALTLPIFLFVLLATTDVFAVAADHLIAKNLSSRAARGAALSTLPDGITSCQDRVSARLAGATFFLADWTYETTNCPYDPYVGIMQGTPVSVTINLLYHPMFLPGDPWALSIQTVDYSR